MILYSFTIIIFIIFLLYDGFSSRRLATDASCGREALAYLVSTGVSRGG